MSPSAKSAIRNLLRGLAWILFVIAGVLFWVGGRTIYESETRSDFSMRDRALAEFAGIGLAAVVGGLGAIAKAAGAHFEEADDGGSRSEKGEFPDK